MALPEMSFCEIQKWNGLTLREYVWKISSALLLKFSVKPHKCILSTYPYALLQITNTKEWEDIFSNNMFGVYSCLYVKIVGVLLCFCYIDNLCGSIGFYRYGGNVIDKNIVKKTLCMK